MSRILIIGSEGFIGSNCVTYFQQQGWEVHGCDLVDYPHGNYTYSKISRLQPSYVQLITGNVFDACINAAGNGSVPVSISHPLSDFEANCTDVINLLDLMRQHNSSCKYIHLSSAAVYGNPEKLPLSEQDALRPISPYGFHKQVAELICKEYHTLYNLQVAIVRPFSIYGPGLRKQLFWDLYQKCKARPDELLLWGTGKESRDFIYVTDLVAALHCILAESPMAANEYNLASGTELTIEEAASRFIHHFGHPIALNFNMQQRHGDPINWRADISEILALGYKSKVSFAEGIKTTVAWLKEQ